MRYHIYWQDKILIKDLEEDEFKDIWGKMHWVYNSELNFVEVGEPILVEHSCCHGSLGSNYHGCNTCCNRLLVHLLYTKDVIYGDERWE